MQPAIVAVAMTAPNINPFFIQAFLVAAVRRRTVGAVESRIRAYSVQSTKLATSLNARNIRAEFKEFFLLIGDCVLLSHKASRMGCETALCQKL